MASIKVKVMAIGNSLGVILPKEALEKLHARKGDELALVESDDGYRLSAYDPELELQMEAARAVMKRYRHALRELAK